MSPSAIFCQAPDSLAALELQNKALKAWYAGKLNSAAPLFEQTSMAYQELENFDKAIYYGNGAVKTLLSIGNRIKAARLAERIYSLANQKIQPPSMLNFDAITNLGTCRLRLSQNSIAIKYYEEALSLIKRGLQIESSSRSTLHGNLGTAYSRIGDFDRSLEYHREAILICENDPKCQSTYLHYVRLFNKSPVLFKIQKYHQAADILKYVSSGLTKTQSQREQKLLVNSLLKLSQIHLVTSQLTEAKLVVERAQEIQLKLQGYRLDRTYKIWCEIYTAENDLAKALNYARKYVFETINKSNNATTEIESARAYTLLAENHAGMQTTDSSRYYFLLAIHTILSIDDFSNPEAKNSFEECQDPQLLLAVFEKYLRTHFNTYVAPKDTAEVNKVIFKAIPQLQKQASRFIEYESSALQFKNKLASQNLVFIETLLNLHSEYPNSGYLRQAVLYSVRLKNSILRQNLLDLEVERSLNQGSPIVMKQYGVKTEINYVQKMIRQGKLSEDQGERELFVLRERLYALTDSLKNIQPFLFNQMNKSFDLHSIDRVHQYLKSTNTSLLDFFQSDSILYVFHLSNDALDYHRIVLTQGLREVFNRVKSSTSEIGGFANGTDGVRSLSEDLHVLYNSILKPVNDKNKLAETVYVIPDGFFNSVPLEVLAKSNCTSCQSFHDVDYLLHDHAFSYLISPDDLLDKATEVKELTAAFFAPSYEKSNGLSELIFAASEYESLSNYTQTKQFAGERINASFFKQNAAAYNIIHLSSHAMADENNSANSVIFFSPEYGPKNEATKLYPEDFQALNLDADMVVLSACETGKGKQYSGEGVFSFSRYFIASGARSVIHNLWKADDFSTSKILSSFYSLLSKGEDKPNALRKAKLSYLENTDDYGAHPYFWSTLTVIGNPQALAENNYVSLWWLATFLILVLVLFGYKKMR